MCGIVGGIATRDLTPVLLEGLRRLEYRGYDSAGIAALDAAGAVNRARSTGKVAELEQRLARQPLTGQLGIAHTRWATHGKASEQNAHPHCSDRLAIVHNGIIENHHPLRLQLQELLLRFLYTCRRI